MKKDVVDAFVTFRLTCSSFINDYQYLESCCLHRKQENGFIFISFSVVRCLDWAHEYYKCSSNKLNWILTPTEQDKIKDPV